MLASSKYILYIDSKILELLQFLLKHLCPLFTMETFHKPKILAVLVKQFYYTIPVALKLLHQTEMNHPKEMASGRHPMTDIVASTMTFILLPPCPEIEAYLQKLYRWPPINIDLLDQS
jgi:hypothetical protein